MRFFRFPKSRLKMKRVLFDFWALAFIMTLALAVQAVPKRENRDRQLVVFRSENPSPAVREFGKTVGPGCDLRVVALRCEGR